jgi:FMN phosphatase YigB (HAD superfamily)
MSHDKLILTDCDGVTVDWLGSFNAWAAKQGFTQAEDGHTEYKMSRRFNISVEVAHKLVTEFNHSDEIERLQPFEDAVEYVKRLHEEHGYRFHAITSLSDDPIAAKRRERNLAELFGDGVFVDVTCLGMGSHKRDALAKYQGSGLWWIEDHPVNADDGHNLGLRSVLIEHGHNMDHECPYPVVKNWREVYALITPPCKS